MLRRPSIMPLVVTVVILLFIYLAILPGYNVHWTGFGESAVIKETTRFAATGEQTGIDSTVERQNPRTIWDWVGLLGVGSVIGVVSYFFARHQRKRDEAIANERRQGEAFQAFLDEISNLMVDKELKLPNQPNRDAKREVAQARTISILLALDQDHKRNPLRLVYELGFLEKDAPLVNLTNANLEQANLSELALPDACLRHVDLRGADLSGANLRGSDLSMADLRGACLLNADLSYTNLTDANLLPYDKGHPAKLSIHNLKDGSTPSTKQLRLFRVKPRITASDLRNTNLEGATLSGTLLGNTDLTRVRGLEPGMIDGAIGDYKTRLPKGLPRPENWQKPVERQLAERLVVARLEDLITQIDALVASKTLSSSRGGDLTAKLKAVRSHQQNNNTQQAIVQIQQFKDQVEALKQSNALTSKQEQAILHTVNEIKSSISYSKNQNG